MNKLARNLLSLLFVVAATKAHSASISASFDPPSSGAGANKIQLSMGAILSPIAKDRAECLKTGKKKSSFTVNVKKLFDGDHPALGHGIVSYQVDAEYYCAGAAHPGAESFAVSYNAETGDPINWEKVLPKLLGRDNQIRGVPYYKVTPDGTAKMVRIMERTRKGSGCTKDDFEYILETPVTIGVTASGIVVLTDGPFAIKACALTVPIALSKAAPDASKASAPSEVAPFVWAAKALRYVEPCQFRSADR